MRMPEKLEIKYHSSLYVGNQMVGTFFDFEVEEEKDNPIAAEIVKRYNSYVAHQFLIEQLLEACKKAREVAPEPCQYDHHGYCQEHNYQMKGECWTIVVDIAITAAEKYKKEMNNELSR